MSCDSAEEGGRERGKASLVLFLTMLFMGPANPVLLVAWMGTKGEGGEARHLFLVSMPCVGHFSYGAEGLLYFS